MKPNYLLAAILVILISSGCENMVDSLAEKQMDRESFHFNFEIRIPANAADLSTNHIELVTDGSLSSSAFGAPKRKDDQYIYYASSFLIFRNSRRFLTISQPYQSDLGFKTELVYELHIPKVARPAAWTPWHPGNYVVADSIDTPLKLMRNELGADAKHSAADYLIEMRYELVKDDLSLHDAMERVRKADRLQKASQPR